MKDKNISILDHLTEIEAQLISVWSGVLKASSIDVNDRFLCLGGNSLKAIKITAEIEKIFSTQLPITLIFKHDTVKKLAEYLKKSKIQKKYTCKIKTSNQNKFFLTDLQKNFYFIYQYQGKHAFVYNVPLVLEINGYLNYLELSKSVDRLVERHAILRTIFYDSTDGLVQEIVKNNNGISLLPELINQDEITEKICEEINKYIPLDKFPLVKIRLFKLACDQHILVIVQPHIITDGWSLKIIKEELFSCYSSFIKKKTPKLPLIKKNYFEYINNLKKINKNNLSDVTYWKSKLEGVQNINFPYDYRRCEGFDFSGKKHSFFIGRELFKKLKDFSALHNVTPFMLIATTLNVLLSWYSSQEDIVIGFPISRRESTLEQTVGLFVNTLVLRNQVSLDKTFIALLQQVREDCLETYAHQHIAFNELVNCLKIKRNFGVHPIFQIMLVWQDWYEEVIHPTKEMTVKSKFIDQRTAKFDLTFELVPTTSNLEGFIEYNTNLFRVETIEILAYQFVSLIEQCIFFYDMPIGKISLKYPVHMMADIPQKSYSEISSIKIPLNVFEDNVKKSPSKIALRYQNKYLSYFELNKEANQLARYIQSKYFYKKKIAKMPIIGIFLNKGMDVIVSILATLKVGAVYVPIDIRSPEQRIKFIVSNSHCSLILTKSTYKEIIKFSNQPLIFLDQEKTEIATHLSSNLPLMNKPNDLMYIIYTSGTTGQPKGVMQTHFNVARLFNVTDQIFHFKATDTWIFFHSHAFDFSVWEIWGAFLYSGQLVIPTDTDITDPCSLYQLIKKHKVTVLNQTPSAFQGFAQECKSHRVDELYLRYIIFGGESLDIKMLSDWWLQYSDTCPVMVNMYGITETTVHTTCKVLSKVDLHRREDSNIGIPLDDMSAFVVDQNMKPVSIGIPGELLVGGSGLAIGYFNQPKMTKQKFIRYLLGDEEKINKGRFYRTGDLVRYLSDGTLEYLGRIDRQIKFKGFRIEAEEIESALRRFHKIARCAIAVKEYHNTKKLVAYYTLKKDNNEELRPQDLQAFLIQTLPSYMIPNLFIKLKQIPLTDNMKTHYEKLPSIENQVMDVQSEFQETMTGPQKVLALIWEENLNVKNVGLDDNFFGIGGDSITSLQVTAEARNKGFYINVSDIFKYQTIREITKSCWNSDKVILTSTHSSAFSMLSDKDKLLLPANSVDAYPISSLQLGMIYHTHYSPYSAVYLDIFTYKVKAIYNHNYFINALQQLINAHPILRTTFHLDTYSIPIQIVHHFSSPMVDVKDLSTLNMNSQNDILKKWVENQKILIFDFKKGPIFRITIHKLSDTLFHIGFSFHHIILDGWSVATFITMLLSIYSALLEGKSSVLDVNEHYREYIYLEKIATTSETQKNFWKNYLDGFEITNISKWHDDQSDDNGFYTHSLLFNRDITEHLIVLSKKLNVSIDVILLTALIKLISILTNSEEILIGVVFNGRPSINEIESTLGLFLNALPFRQKVFNSSWSDLILSISNNKSEIYPYRRYPLIKIQEDINSIQLFNIIFYFTNFHIYNNIKKYKKLKIIEQNFYERTNFPITFNFSLQERLKLFINYETRYYTHDQVEKFSDYLYTILNAILNDVNAYHNTCDVLSPKEKRLILSSWNNTSISYNLDCPVHQLVELQSKKTPSHIALKFNQTELNYKKLNDKADSFSTYLKNKGVLPGDFIVVYMQRGIDSIIVLLSILKSGCVYVPIDMMQPIERVEYILNEVNCKFILSNRIVIDSLNINSIFLDKLIIVDSFFKESSEDKSINSFPSKKTDLAYVIYTSGSTGAPKGVMVSHASLVNFLLCMKKKIGIQDEDRLLALTSFSFDISLLEILLPLITGATCLVAGNDQNKDPNWIINTIRQEKINLLQATPTTWKMLFDFGYQLDHSIKAISGGEPLTQSIAEFLTKGHSAWNLYGPTETTIWSTCFSIQQKNNSISPVPIGMPIANTKVYVLDRNLKPVSIGVPGELYITGIGVAKGYLRQKQLTKEKFIDNPFDTVDEVYAKIYKTGDLVKWLPNGTLYFISRIDHQFKLRGFRIEAGDIESALLQHHSVKESVILVRKINDIDYIIAYIVLNYKDKVPTEKELRTFLLKKLPYYMLPEKFIFIDSLPINTNGKIDIKTLFSLDVEKTKSLEKEKQYLLTEEQKLVSDIWCRILNIQSISPDDNFYDLGGNSILSLIVVQNINDKFSTNLSIRDFIEHPTLSDLSDFIMQNRGNERKNNSEIEIFNFFKKIPNPIITLRKQGRRTPLFLIHPVGGTVFYYIPLVKRLLSDRPVYAIQDPGIEAKDRLFSSLSEMVEFYISVMKKYQPHGPYYIAGSSFGANAAVEMTQQLNKQGELVPFTGLIDGWAKYPDQANRDRTWFEDNLKTQMRAMSILIPEICLTDLLLDIHWHRQQLLVQHDLPNNLNLSLTLFKAQETMKVLKPLESPYNNWERYCSVPPTTYIVPGDHFTMHFEPHVATLANVFDTCLEGSDTQNKE